MVTLTDVFEDADGDGFSDQYEISFGTNPVNPSDKPGINDGLLGYWPLDGNTSDLSTHERNGTIYGGASFQNGAVGQGLSFDGSNDSFVIPSFIIGGNDHRILGEN